MTSSVPVAHSQPRPAPPRPGGILEPARTWAQLSFTSPRPGWLLGRLWPKREATDEAALAADRHTHKTHKSPCCKGAEGGGGRSPNINNTSPKKQPQQRSGGPAAMLHY